MILNIELPEEQGGSPEGQSVRDIAEAMNEFEAMKASGESGILASVVHEDLRAALSKQDKKARVRQGMNWNRAKSSAQI